MKTLKVKATFTEEILGTCSSSPDLYEKYIVEKLEKNPNKSDEIDAVCSTLMEYEETETAAPQTVFPRTEDGLPFLYDYQIKGFFKDTCSALRKVKGTESSKIKAFKKEIDGLIFPKPREIIIHTDEPIGFCSRPLRASTPQGERVSIAKSEAIGAGAWIEFEIMLMCDDHEKAVREWLAYGEFRGIGQWRNSGKGRFTCDSIETV